MKICKVVKVLLPTTYQKSEVSSTFTKCIVPIACLNGYYPVKRSNFCPRKHSAVVPTANNVIHLQPYEHEYPQHETITPLTTAKIHPSNIIIKQPVNPKQILECLTTLNRYYKQANEGRHRATQPTETKGYIKSRVQQPPNSKYPISY